MKYLHGEQEESERRLIGPGFLTAVMTSSLEVKLRPQLGFSFRLIK